MVTVPGALPFATGKFKLGVTSVRLPTDGLGLGPWGALKSLDGDVGAFISSQPANFLPRGYRGALMQSYFNDYYNRVWFVPTSLDFGPITTTSSKRVYLWNAHTRPTTLDEIVLPDDESITISGISTPATFKPLGGAYFTIWAAGDGQPSIDATFRFTFSPLEVVRLRTTGVRSRLWDFPPNWSSPYEVSLDFLSEIITSNSGKEQRRAIRQTPRKGFSFNSLVHGEKFRRFIRHMSVWQARSTVIPEFNRSTHLEIDLHAGQSGALVTKVPDWLVPGRLVVMMDKERSILRTIDAVVGNSISFSSTIDGEWPKGSRIYSAAAGRLGTQLQGTQHTNRAMSVGLRFAVDAGREEWPSAGVPDVMHRGREVFLKRPNWQGSPTPEFTSVIDKVDYGWGRDDNFLPVDFNTRYHKGEYLGINTDDVESIINFFRRQYGQVGEFFMPTFTEDLEFKYDAPLGTANIRVDGFGTADDYVAGTVYRDLVVFLNDGSYLLRSVQSIYQVSDHLGDDSVIQVATPWPLDLNVNNIRQVCWMPLWRFATDGLTIQYVTNEKAQIALSMKTLEYHPGEGLL
ncbi:hypothetical protein G3A39_39355 [Paraburkholderia aspalathi]|nr:hypothetical protein [Paraburkholderia aspalathi]